MAVASAGLVLLTMLAAACGPATEAVVETSSPVVEEARPTPGPQVVTGRTMLAAAQGEAHVLWFWGAH